MAEIKVPRMVIDQSPTAPEDAAAPAADEAAVSIKPKAATAQASASPKAASAKKTSKPKTTVVVEAADHEGEPESDRPAAAKPKATTSPDVAPASDAVMAGPQAGRSFSSWLSRTFPGREHTFLGALAGLVFAILFFLIGPLRAIFVALLVAIGAFVGLILDGDRRVVSVLRRIFGGDQTP